MDAGCEALAATGAVIRIRPVQLADADALRTLHGRTSDANIRLRFLARTASAW